MKNQLLLLEDLEGIGRKGDIVLIKSPGFARNYLIPQKKAVWAEKHLVRLQERLKEERAKQSVIDKQESLTLSKQLEDKKLKVQVKIDNEGHMYGSITAQEIAGLLKEQLNVKLDKRSVVLPKGLKKIGIHEIELKLKEGIFAKIILEIVPEEKASV